MDKFVIQFGGGRLMGRDFQIDNFWFTAEDSAAQLADGQTAVERFRERTGPSAPCSMATSAGA